MGLLDLIKKTNDIQDIRAEQAAAKARGSSLYKIRLTPEQEARLDRMMKHQAKATGRDK
jgi:hypothetical protein